MKIKIDKGENWIIGLFFKNAIDAEESSRVYFNFDLF